MTPQNTKSPRRGTLDWWAKGMWNLYKNKDTERLPEQIWLSVVEYASKIAEDTRKGAISDLPKHLAHAFAWMASFVAKCNYDPEIHPHFKISDGFSDIVTFKYPGICGTCGKPECTCTLLKGALERAAGKKPPYTDRIKTRKEFQRSSHYHNMNVYKWVNMFQRIYKEIIPGLSPEHIAFHFMEEVGEVADAMTTLHEKYHEIPENLLQISSIEKAVKEYEIGSGETKRLLDMKLTLATEIADCFSWWCSLYLKMEQIMGEVAKTLRGFKVPQYYVNRVLTNEYKISGDRKIICPNCKRTTCECSILLDGLQQ